MERVKINQTENLSPKPYKMYFQITSYGRNETQKDIFIRVN
jgi:hypothetical protein